VFQNLHEPGKKANIYFVVVGPTGVFVVEAKNISGKIGISGSYIIVNGVPFAKQDIIQEVVNEYLGLHKYLKNALGEEIFITPILAFTNKHSFVPLGFGPIVAGIHIMQIQGIIRFITTQPMQKRKTIDEILITVLQNITE